MTRTDPHGDFQPPFTVTEPGEQTAPFLVNVPHAGDVYPPAFLSASQLSPAALRRSEDALVDRLFAGVVALGVPVMSARFPRAYLDLNREPYELDPRMFEGRLPAYCNTRSMRVAGGLGTVPKIVADGHEIYRGRLAVAEALDRIETLYKPYHARLRDRLREIHDLFGTAILVDAHSMPSAGLGRDDGARADIVLGDRYGTSCAPILTDIVGNAFRASGFRVAHNKPYAGGFITEHYGEPALGRHAIQIEINRALYMDERSLKPLAGFASLAGDIAGIVDQVLREADEAFRPMRIAAE